MTLLIRRRSRRSRAPWPLLFLALYHNRLVQTLRTEHDVACGSSVFQFAGSTRVDDRSHPTDDSRRTA